MKASSAARSDGGQELTVEITVRVKVSGTTKKEKKKPISVWKVWFGLVFFKNVKMEFEDILCMYYVI